MRALVDIQNCRINLNGCFAANTEEVMVINRTDANKFINGTYKVIVSSRGQYLAELEVVADDDYSIDGIIDLNTSEVDDFSADGFDKDNTVIVSLYRLAEGEYVFVAYGIARMQYTD